MMASTSQQIEQTVYPSFLEETELSKWLLQPEKEQQTGGCFTFEFFLPDADPEVWLAENTGSYIDSQLPLLPSYGTSPDQVPSVNLGNILNAVDVISHSSNDQWLTCVQFDFFEEVSEQDDNEWLLTPSQHLAKTQEQEEQMEEGETVSRLQVTNQNTTPVVNQEMVKGQQKLQAGRKKARGGKRGREQPVSQLPSRSMTGGKRTKKK